MLALHMTDQFLEVESSEVDLAFPAIERSAKRRLLNSSSFIDDVSVCPARKAGEKAYGASCRYPMSQM